VDRNAALGPSPIAQHVQDFQAAKQPEWFNDKPLPLGGDVTFRNLQESRAHDTFSIPELNPAVFTSLGYSQTTEPDNRFLPLAPECQFPGTSVQTPNLTSGPHDFNYPEPSPLSSFLSVDPSATAPADCLYIPSEETLQLNNSPSHEAIHDGTDAPTPSTISSKPRNFLCHKEDCNAAFHRRGDRDRHMRKHDGKSRVHVCNVQSCGKRFYRKDKLSSHVRNMHQNRT
jgi:hypothetical protein